MKPTAILIDEHKAIKRMLGVAGRVSDRLERGEAVPPEHLAKITEFIRGFADRCHHAKEEGLLFPAMEKAGIPREGGPIGVMFHEHKAGRDYVRKMTDAAAKCSAGDPQGGSEFAAHARGYIDLLQRHIDKEDNVLYRMADARLTEADQIALVKGFSLVEREAAGPGAHERYHAILTELEAAYPG